MIDLKNDFPTEWYRLVSADKRKPSSMPLVALQDRLPLFRKETQVKAETISVIISSDQKNRHEAGYYIGLDGQGDSQS